MRNAMSSGHTILPFAKLNYAQFEKFVFETLCSGLRAEVPASKKPRRISRTYRVVSATAYGGPGHKQRGIDFLCTMDDGSDWVFQAKLMPKFGLDDAKKAVRKARTEFPNAKRYILLVSGIANPKAIDYVRTQPNWEIWDGPTLTANFLRRIPVKNQLENIGRAWPSLASQTIAELYPLRDQLLVTPDEFFATWMQPDRLFHHRSTLVGHADILDRLSAFVRDPVQRVAILVAPGGRGKSRLLLAIAERFAKKNPNVEVRFVDPHAPATARPDSLRYAGDTDFVIVQDDAHRAETIRPELFAILSGTKGKIILATRPQAVSSLEHHLVRCGISAHTHLAPIHLPKLKLPEYEALARAELDAAHRHHAGFLARAGRDCPLVITVGAALINKNLIPADRFEEKVFQAEVFARFEGEELDHLAGNLPRDRVRKVLQALAVLAPWQEKDVDLKTVAAFVGCSEADLQAVLTQLEAGQLIVKSGKGRRVVPDLFADHLVYTACYDPDGQLSAFAKELAELFSGKANQTMLRNLSEADWQAARYHNNPASLIEPFWQQFWKHFTKSNFFDRSQLIEKWGAHSVYQPARSLELARVAIDLDKAPRPKQPWARGKTGNQMFSHQRVLSVLPGMLEPIGIYHEDHRDHALDLLLELAAIWPSEAKLDDQNHPWTVIHRIAEFKLDHPITAAKGVLDWLDQNLSDPRLKSIHATPSGVLNKVLTPIFARTLNATYSDGRTVSFSYPPINPRQTQHLRDQALDLIEKKIFPLGEIATLNVLPVLQTAIEPSRGHFGNQVPDALKSQWEPERHKALDVIERLIAAQPSPRVQWRIRTFLRHLVRLEKTSKLHRRAETLLNKLPLAGDIREVAAICSHGWHEFEEVLFKPGVKPSSMKDEVEKRWDAALTAVAKDLVQRFQKAPALLTHLEREAAKCHAVGFSDNIRRLLFTIGTFDLPMAKACVEHLLQKDSTLRVAWTSFLPASVKFPDPWLEKTCLRAIKSRSVPLIGRALDLLSSGYISEVPNTLVTDVGRWAKSIPASHSGLAVAALGYPRNPSDPVWHAVAANLNLSKLKPTQISAIVESLGRGMRHDKFTPPQEFLDTLLKEMVRITDVGHDRCDDFLSVIADRDPRAVFDLFVERIRYQRKGLKSGEYHPIPLDVLPFTKLPNSPGYPKLAKEIFQKVRSSPALERYAYETLFGAAVLRVSPIAIPLLISWAKSAKSIDELYAIGRLGRFEGSMLYLKHPELTLALLRQSRKLKPQESPQYQAYLAGSMGPLVRSYENGVRDKEQQYVAAEATKLLAGPGSAELKAFYRAVINHEQSIDIPFGRADDE